MELFILRILPYNSISVLYINLTKQGHVSLGAKILISCDVCANDKLKRDE